MCPGSQEVLADLVKVSHAHHEVLKKIAVMLTGMALGMPLTQEDRERAEDMQYKLQTLDYLFGDDK